MPEVTPLFPAPEALVMNNITLLTADFTTHLKIIAIALVATALATLVVIRDQTPRSSEPASQTMGQAAAPGN